MGRLFNQTVRGAIFPEAKGRAWLKHNIEEVGLLVEILPGLYVGWITWQLNARSSGARYAAFV